MYSSVTYIAGKFSIICNSLNNNYEKSIVNNILEIEAHISEPGTIALSSHLV
jgi:hypothetical protein